MTERELEKYCEENGVPHRAPHGNDPLRVMDKTVLPMAMREAFDSRGFYRGPEQSEEADEAPAPDAEADEVTQVNDPQSEQSEEADEDTRRDEETAGTGRDDS